MKVTRVSSRVLSIDASPSFGPAGPEPGELPTWEYLLTSLETDEGLTGHSMM